MKKNIIEKITLKEDNDKLAISMLKQKPLEVISIKTTRTGEFEYVKLISYSVYSDISYEDLVNKLIAERYTIQDELAIQRKYQRGENTAEFDEYYTFVEECKAQAKEFIAERGAIDE